MDAPHIRELSIKPAKVGREKIKCRTRLLGERSSPRPGLDGGEGVSILQYTCFSGVVVGAMFSLDMGYECTCTWVSKPISSGWRFDMLIQIIGSETLL